MFDKFEKVDDLTSIAKEYNLNIDHVAFCRLPDRRLGTVYRSHDAVEKYRIYIDRGKLACPFQILFVLFHELGHIALYHLGYRYGFYCESLRKEYMENEAHAWAFKEMGVVNSQGNIYDKYRACYECVMGRVISGKSTTGDVSCLKTKSSL